MWFHWILDFPKLNESFNSHEYHKILIGLLRAPRAYDRLTCARARERASSTTHTAYTKRFASILHTYRIKAFKLIEFTDRSGDHRFRNCTQTHISQIGCNTIRRNTQRRRNLRRTNYLYAAAGLVWRVTFNDTADNVDCDALFECGFSTWWARRRLCSLGKRIQTPLSRHFEPKRIILVASRALFTYWGGHVRRCKRSAERWLMEPMSPRLA